MTEEKDLEKRTHIELSDDIADLWKKMDVLHRAQRDHTRSNYDRINPFAEDLFDWTEKGDYLGCKDTRIYDSATIIGDVKLGNNVWIGPQCMLDGSGGLTIGDWCDLSTGVKIFTHDTARRALTKGSHQIEKAHVSIGDCCFIGTDTIILKGVSIGDHCVIGAKSLINKDIPPFSIAAGSPAKVIGHIEINGEQVNFIYEEC